MRFLLLPLLILLGSFPIGCSSPSCPQGQLIIGIISYDEGARTAEMYKNFKDYLAEKTCTFVEIEPVFNELNAMEKIKSRNWSLVFVPPGLTAIAIQEQYDPIFPLQELPNQRSVIIVKRVSNIQKISDLKSKIIALGTPGSAVGYYLPLYDLYGLTLAEVRFSSTAKISLKWLEQNQVDAVALSEDEFQRDRQQFKPNEFRIIHKTRVLPSGVVLLSPTVERKQEEQIIRAMKQANAILTTDAGYIPNAKVPDYRQFITLVNKVKPLEVKLKNKPAILTLNKN